MTIASPAVLSSISWTICGPCSPSRVRSSRSTAGSKDCSITGPCAPVASSRRSSSATSSAIGSPCWVDQSGVLELGQHADRPVVGGARAHQRDDLAEREDAEVPVVGGVQRPQLGHPLDRAQRAQLGEREVLGEPAGADLVVHLLGGPAVGELGAAGDVGGQGELVLVADDEDAVPADHHVRLDQFGAEVDRQLVAGGRVLRAVCRSAPVADDHGLGKAGRRSHVPATPSRACPSHTHESDGGGDN